MAAPSTPSKPLTIHALPHAESPLTRKVTNAAASSPAVLALETKRGNALKDLNEVVPQLPVQFFTGDRGILPPLREDLDIQQIIEQLKANGTLKCQPDDFPPPNSKSKKPHTPPNPRTANSPPYRWKQFPRDPSTCDDTENDVFQGIQQLVTAIKEASTTTANVTLDFLCNPDRKVIAATRDNDTRPDCYGVLKDFEAAGLTAKGHKKPYWLDIGVPGEFKKGSARQDEVDNWTQLIWSLHYIMQEDPRRRFVFAFTIENATMRIWFASRSDVLVSLPFNFIEKYHETVEFFLRLMYASEAQLGWDTTMERLDRRSTSEPFQYRIKCADATYKTVRIISEIGAEALRGRGTRVWEVRKIDEHGNEDEKPIVLKDAWVDADRKREHAILQEVRQEAEKQGLLEGFERHFMKIRAADDIYIDGKLDHTHALILRGRSLSEQSKELLKIPVTPTPGEQPTQASRVTIHEGKPKPKKSKPEPKKPKHEPVTRDKPLGASEQAQDPVEKILQYSAKVHYRIVFEELGCTIAETDTLSASMSAFSDALKGLKLLHQCGWVHRDISAGNVLVIDGVGKLSDLEYAKHEKDEETHGVRTGTPDFTSAEVEFQRYEYAPPDLKLQKGGTRLGRTPAELLATLCQDPKGGQAAGSSTSVDGQSNAQGASPPNGTSRPGPLDEIATESGATGSSSGLKKRRPYDPAEFRHNPLHDLESMMWLGSWLLVRRRFKKPDSILDTAWAEYIKLQNTCAYNLFSEFSFRISIVRSVNEEFLKCFVDMAPQLETIATSLDTFRERLYARYMSALLHRYQVKEQPPFAPMAEGLHDSLLEELDTALALLTGPHGARLDLQIDRSVRKQNRATTEPQRSNIIHSVSNSSKRTSDAIQTESGRRSSKRQKTSRVPPPTAGPSTRTRSRSQRN